MKSIVDAREFAAALKKVMGVTRKTRIPELGQVKAEFTGTSCKLTATDFNVWLMKEIPAQGEAFSFVFSNTKAVERACRFFDGNLTLRLTVDGENRKLSLACGGRSGEFSVWKDEDCHTLPTDEVRWRYSVNAAKLYERVKRVRYASMPGAQRAEFSCVRFEEHHVWCMDGTRMAVSDDASLNVSSRFIAPMDAVNKLSVFGDVDISIEVGARYIAFTGDNTTVMTRHIDASDTLKPENILQMKGAQQTRTVNRGEYLKSLKYLDCCTQGLNRRYMPLTAPW